MSGPIGVRVFVLKNSRNGKMGSIYVVPERTAHQYSVCFQCSTTTSTSLDHYTERDRVSESQLLDSFNFRKQRFLWLLLLFWCVVSFGPNTERVCVYVSLVCSKCAKAFVSCFRVRLFTNFTDFRRKYFTRALLFHSLVRRHTHVTRLRNSLSDRFASFFAQ